MQSQRIPGRKRGRPSLHSTPMKMAVHNLYSASAGSLPAVKIPKKRGRKPGYKIKSRVLMTPLALSPPRSTPEPDLSSIPQDAATVPSLAAPQALTVSASFDGKQHLRSLPVVNSVGYVLRFLAKLCRSLLCDDLFSHQPFPRGYSASEKVQEKEEGRMESAKTVTTEEYLVNPVGMNRYGMDPSASTFNHRGSLPPSSSLYCKRQNSGDSHLGGGPAATAGGPRTSPMSSGGPSAPGLRPPASSPKRNATSLEGNRCASSPSQDAQDARRPRSRNPSAWTVEDVVWFVKDADPQALGPHVELFRKHEIDGNALLLLKSDMVMKYLGLKLGPALKLCYHIDKLKQAKF
ncbi:PREDICTED: sex comb on midleg-like protein 4 isoform X3 [Colobus angolensis palliatus]|uniref:sex comb on midleg-like protein 4 isoform X3 n=1 Tax=Colobus angolensis palliatus TaxID=336983 RepID=UPI0005F53F43|nr:PREDICTED: sex comb on midleg-like protein 4 isoform X3 [Colobus angolensis palliatus]